MTVQVWDGDVSSLCAKVGMLGGSQSAGNCSNWSGHDRDGGSAKGRMMWAQSQRAAFAKSYMPAVSLSSAADVGCAEPRYYVFFGSQAANVHLGSGQQLQLAAEEVVLLRMSDPLSWAINKPYIGNSLIIDEPMLRETCRSYERLLGRHLHFQYRLERPLHELLTIAQRALESGGFEGTGDDLAHAILRILSLADIDDGLSSGSGSAPGGDAGIRCVRIQNFIDQHFRDPDFGVGMIAHHFDISARYIQLIMSRNGSTASELIRTRRLQEASRMLRAERDKHLTITEIAFDCGFNSSAYFSTEFRRAFGICPRSYRAINMSA